MSKSKASRERERQKNQERANKQRRENPCRAKRNPCRVEYNLNDVDFMKAEQLQVQIEPDALPLKCWDNVARKVERDGGKAVYGWSIDEDSAPGVRRLIAHTIWESPKGERIDITPSKHNDQFLEDARAGPGHPVGYCLRDHTLDAYNRMMQLAEHDRWLIESGKVR